jgi:hypothetical protein
MNAITLNMESSLTDLDWKVIEMARDDGPRSINPDRAFTRFLQNFFGLPITRKLANESLETLRRFCVRAWYWDLIRTQDMRSLMEAGYSSADAFRILAHVARHRGFTPSIQEQAI